MNFFQKQEEYQQTLLQDFAQGFKVSGTSLNALRSGQQIRAIPKIPTVAFRSSQASTGPAPAAEAVAPASIVGSASSFAAKGRYSGTPAAAPSAQETSETAPNQSPSPAKVTQDSEKKPMKHKYVLKAPQITHLGSSQFDLLKQSTAYVMDSEESPFKHRE